MTAYFQYGEKETGHLKRADRRLAEAIEKIGPIKREVIPDLFAALINAIAGQQISTKAHRTVWERIRKELGRVTPDAVDRIPPERLQKTGISHRKAAYMKSAARKVLSGEFDLDALTAMPDEKVCEKLSELDGVGVWTAEMLMIFSMQRPDILSYNDSAIIKGLRLLYGHRTIDKARFERYRKRYSPYASVASLYLWAVASGEADGL